MYIGKLFTRISGITLILEVEGTDSGKRNTQEGQQDGSLIKALATLPDYLSWIPGNPAVEGGTIISCLLTTICTLWHLLPTQINR